MFCLVAFIINKLFQLFILHKYFGLLTVIENSVNIKLSRFNIELKNMLRLS